MRSTKRRTRLVLSLALLQLGIDAILIVRFPPKGRDFVIQLTAGRVADLDGQDQIYDPHAQSIRQAEIRNSSAESLPLLVFNHPPVLLPLLRPLSRTEPNSAWLIWSVVSGLIFVGVAFLVTPGMLRHGVEFAQASAVRLGLLAFFPVALSIAQGQDTALVCLGAGACVYFLGTGRDIPAGLSLSLATIRPHIALGLALPFFFARKGVIRGFLIGAGLLASYSVTMIGISGVADYIDVLRYTGLGDTWPIGETRMPNVLGLLHRVGFAGGQASPALIAWAIWLAFIGASCRFWKAYGEQISPTHFGLLIVGTVVFVPHIHLHDAALLAIVPAIAASTRLHAGRSDWENPVLALGAASLILAVVSISYFPVFDVLLAAALLLIAVPLVRDSGIASSVFSDSRID